MVVQNIVALHDAIEAVCPILGVDSAGDISFAPSATAAQQTAARAIVASWVDPPPVPSCQLWQLQAVLSSTQWSAVQTAVANLNNPAVTAFLSRGDAVIPGNSVTLANLGAAIGLTAAQVTALVAQASTVTLP